MNSPAESAGTSQLDQPAQPQRSLTLLDTTSIIVGIIIGSTIFKSSPLISAAAAGWMTATLQQLTGWPAASDASGLVTAQYLGIAAIWIAGGVIALLGALCYAELATALPHEGGNYVFLTEAFGRPAGFAFAWTELWIVRPGNIGAIAFVMATFALPLLPESLRAAFGARGEMILAIGAITVLTIVNALGIQVERWTQNLLTALKVIGLLVVAITAWCFISPGTAPAVPASPPPQPFTLGIILVMFAYGGWSDMPYVASEVADPRKNLTRALLLGTGSVTVIYLLLNLGFAWGLGLGGLYESRAVASDVMQAALGNLGDRAISLLVVISCLGAIHGMLFTGARVFYRLGTDHPLFHWLGAWNSRREIPLRSLLTQSAVTIALVLFFGSTAQAFDRLVVFTAPFYWGFICLVIFALAALRWRGVLSEERYRVPLYPLPAILFCLACIWMCYSALSYAWQNRAWEGFWAIGVVIAGCALAVIDQQYHRRANDRKR